MIAIIAAVARNGVIGCDGHIPWHITGEQARFRDLTTGNVVVMGRRTYEEIGRPLPGRNTIVVSRTKCYVGSNLVTVASLAQALDVAHRQFAHKDVFISGGAALYREALPLADVLYLTRIDADISGDTFFPNFDRSCFSESCEPVVVAELCYCYLTYTRISNVRNTLLQGERKHPE